MINQILANHGVRKVTVGMGATILEWSDRVACTVIAVNKSGTRITIQEDTAIRTDNNGMSDAQSYRYEANPNGPKHTASKRKDGRWRLAGGRTVVMVGDRRHYHDFSF